MYTSRGFVDSVLIPISARYVETEAGSSTIETTNAASKVHMLFHPAGWWAAVGSWNTLLNNAPIN